MKITVIGTGHVGLVVGTCLADSGNEVIGVDIDVKKVRTLRRGRSPIYEPGLEELLERNLKEKRLSFTNDLGLAVSKSEVIFLALPTPPMNDGSADLKTILDVASQIGKAMNGYKVIVNKSTVPVGTAEKVREVLKQETKYEFDVVSNPEFLKEGTAVNDFMKPDRVIIGLRSGKAIAIMQELYSPFVRTGNPILVMDERSAELTKYAANAFLATKVSFMNEIANICERAGADVDMVRRGLGTDPRIGSQFLFAGVGYGGSCFPKDVRALINASKHLNYEPRILQAVDAVNEHQRLVLVKKIRDWFDGSLEGKTLALWGLTFKPNTDDVRDAPSIVIIRELISQGAKVRVYDPIAIEQARPLFNSQVYFGKTNYDVLKAADALAIITEWNEFRRPDFEKMKQLMKHPVIFDGRNIYEPQMVTEKGFTYFGIGRAAPKGKL